MGISARLLIRLKADQAIILDGYPVYTNFIVQSAGSLIVNLFSEDKTHSVIPKPPDPEVFYEDDHIICLYKPSGICTHPVGKHIDSTLGNHLKYYYLSKNMDIAIRPISRLDKDTSGIITFAKNEYAQDRFDYESVDKQYIAILHGRLAQRNGVIEAPILRKTFMQREVNENGKKAVTQYHVTAENESYSVVRANILTGRTHQIRVHFSYLGNPVVGDNLYPGADANPDVSRLALHSAGLSFVHPVSGWKIHLKCEPREDFKKVMDACGFSH